MKQIGRSEIFILEMLKSLTKSFFIILNFKLKLYPMSTFKLPPFFILILCCFILTPRGLTAQSSDTSKPNVVLILIDDLSHLGVTSYGATRVTSNRGLFENVAFTTPQMDRLATEGIMFNNAHAYPLCEATRIALMSGKNNSRNYLRCKSQHASDVTFGDIFRKNGYATGIFGKWKQTRGTKEIHGKDYIFEFGWDEFTCFDVITEGQRFINPNLVRNGTVMDYKGRKDVDPQTGRRWYGPDICNRDALQFIEKNKDRPFFLYYPMLLVHDEHQPTPDTKPREIFDNFNEEKNKKTGYKADDHRFFPDMIAYTDKLIGKVISKLEALNLMENTLLIVMGDNGTKESFTHVFPNGKKYPARKGGTADNGTHVPLIMSYPKNFSAPFTYNGLVNLTDILPTLCDAAGIEIPRKEELDGISFWNAINTGKPSHRDVIYTWYNANNLYTDHSELLRFAFNKDFKYYAPTPEFPEGRFFDLRTDPLELEGDHFEERRFKLRLYSGLKRNKLTKEQKEAYLYLKNEIENNNHIPVSGLKIEASKTQITMGQTLQLTHTIIPENATRNNVVWHSENPQIASIDKFGVLTAHQPGEVVIKLYSWDDAYPLSANTSVTYKTDGIHDKLTVIVE